jgi:hypothetical protein
MLQIASFPTESFQAVAIVPTVPKFPSDPFRLLLLSLFNLYGIQAKQLQGSAEDEA